MSNCLIELKRGNQEIIDKLTLINKNNDNQDQQYNEINAENEKLQNEVKNSKNIINTSNNWYINKQIKINEDKLSCVKLK